MNRLEQIAYDVRFYPNADGVAEGIAIAIRHPEYAVAVLREYCADVNPILTDSTPQWTWDYYMQRADKLVERFPIVGRADV